MFQHSAGDMEFKQNKFLSAEKQIVTANPDINIVSLLLWISAYFLSGIDISQFPSCNLVKSIIKYLVKSLRTY